MELALKQALLSLIALSGRMELVLTVLTIDLGINFTIGLLGLYTELPGSRGKSSCFNALN